MTNHEAIVRFLEAVRACKNGDLLAPALAAGDIVLGGQQIGTLIFAARCVAHLIVDDADDLIAALEALNLENVK